MAAEFDKHRPDGTFARGDVAGKPDSQHHIARRMRAALRVFFIKVAIVIGPTPPGTGVSSDATSFTARSSTSPTQMYPRFSNSFRRVSSFPKSRSKSARL